MVGGEKAPTLHLMLSGDARVPEPGHAHDPGSVLSLSTRGILNSRASIYRDPKWCADLILSRSSCSPVSIIVMLINRARFINAPA